MLGVNWKHVQLVKIYMPSNCEVNLITRLDVIAIFSSLFCSKGHMRYCHHLASIIRPLTFHILIFSSETTWPNGTKLGSKHLYKVLYKVSPFRSVPPTNMAAKGNSCFWLATVLKNILLWKCLAKWSQTWQEASMQDPLESFLIWFHSANKHGRQD